MKSRIEPFLSGATQDTKATNPGKTAQERNSTPWRDRTIPSEMQSALKLGLQVVQRASEEREARVETLRAQINAGTYRVDIQMLAERILLNDL